MQDTTGQPVHPPTNPGPNALLHPALDGAFSAVAPAANHPDWSPHLPFLLWLVSIRRPDTLLALGWNAFPAFAACCDLVDRLKLPTRCRLLLPPSSEAADSRADLRRLHAAQHAAFARLDTVDTEEQYDAVADRSLDLLLIDADDGENRADASGGDRFARWLPKLAPGALVVLRRPPVSDGRGEDPFAVPAGACPAFSLRPDSALVVLAPGGQVPESVAFLFALPAGSAEALRLRDRFALLGERWRVEAEFHEEQENRTRRADAERATLQTTRNALGALSTAHDRLRDELAFTKADRFRLEEQLAAATSRLREQDGQHQDALRNAAEQADRRADAEAAAIHRRLDALHHLAGQENERQRHELQGALQADRDRADQLLGQARSDAEALRAALQRAETRLSALHSSASWRWTEPLRRVRAALRPAPAEQEPAATPPHAPIPVEAPAPAEPAPAPAETTPVVPVADAPPAEVPVADSAPAAIVGVSGWRPIRRILFVAGEPGTPGAAYRTARNAAACRAAGYEADHVDIAGVNPENLGAADLLVLWRAGHSGHVQTMLELAAAARTRVAFDIDDLIIQPSLAVAEIIDGIRTAFVTEAESRSYFQSMQRTLTSSDLCIATTRELAAAAGAMHPMVQVIPNAFDATVERASRRAARLRGERSGDGLVRLGYAGGTRTHQRDFASIAPALATVLRDRPQTRLVLFRDASSGEGLVLVEEFPELAAFADRIEWRDMVPLADLPAEMARFDVSLCPLELDNPFCEAKSELKYFESALAGVCLVASPTGPFRRAVRDGVTGFLPPDERGWTDALLALVDDPALRRRVARDARNDVLWRFGPRRQAELWALLLRQLDGGVEGARAADLALRRGDHPPAGLPEVPEGEVLFSFDRLGEARVTVGMTSFNYAAHLPEALDSVAAQTLRHLDLVVVDDGSSDDSVALLLDWAERNRTRFNRVRILRTLLNAGLGGARNLMMDEAETPWIMVLDSDNHLAPDACETLLRAVDADPMAAFAYPRIRQFGGADLVMGADDFQVSRLAAGNYIDAMALVAKWAWAAAGGYYVRRDAMGWEDFSLWCRLAELGLHGVPVAAELGFYRVHARSMVNAITEQSDNKRTMVGFVEARHPWLRLRMRAARKRLERPAAR